MDRLFSIFLFLLGVTYTVSLSAQEVETLKPGVVKITAQVQGQRQVGTGFIVKLEQDAVFVVTASHVIEGASQLQVAFFTRPHRPLTARTLRLEGGDPRGLAVILVEGNIPPGVRALNLDKYAQIAAGDSISLVGFPLIAGTSWAVAHGTITGQRGRDITFSSSADEGNSGGPLIKNGEVIGVITGVQAPFGYATPAATVLLTLEGWGIRETPRDDYRAYYELGKTHERAGNYKEYVQTLEALLQNERVLSKLAQPERRKKELELHLELALTLMGEDYIEGIPGRKQKALTHAEKARLLDRRHPMLLILLGFITASEAADHLSDPKTKMADIESIFKDAKKAIVERNMSEELYTDVTVQYHYWSGRALGQLDEYNGAKEELEAGLAIVNKNMPRMSKLKDMFLFRLGVTEFDRSNDVGAALQYWKDVSNEDYVSRALTLTGFGYWHDGWDARRKGNEQKAKEKFNAAESALAGAKELGHRSRALVLTLGVLYFSRRDYVNAATNFEDVIKFNPEVSIGFYWVGRSKFLIKGGLEEARKAMAHAAELDPDDAKTRYWLGRILAKAGDTANARSEFEKTLELDSNYTKAYVHVITAILVMSVEKEDNSPEMISMYEEALKHARVGLSVSEQQKDTSTAERIRGLQHMTWNGLAYKYAERGEYLPLATQYIEYALEAQPGKAYYLDTKAWILIRTVELSRDLTASQKEQLLREAKELLNQSLDSFPTAEADAMAKAELFYHLGYIEKLRGRTEEAQGFFLKALELNPQYEKAKKEMQ